MAQRRILLSHSAAGSQQQLDQVPIGRPISNSRVYITDAQGRLCAPGIAGEICVAGDGLARGYLNNPELTASKVYRSLLSSRRTSLQNRRPGALAS